MKNNRAIIELNIAAMLFGFAALFAKGLSLDAPWLVFGRTFFAAIALLIIIYYKKISLSIPWHRLFALSVSGVILAAHWWTFFYSVKVSSVTAGLVGFALFPVVTSWLEPIVEKTPWRRVDLFTALLCSAGLVIIAKTESPASNQLIGFFWGAVSALLFSILALVNRRFARNTHPLNITFYQIVFACLAISLLGMQNWTLPSTSQWLGLILLGSVFTALAHLLYIQALSQVKASLASIIIAMEPIYGIGLAILLFSEMPGIGVFIGSGFIFASVIIALRAH